jgi:predicted acylesterase/phospholipase RssA
MITTIVLSGGGAKILTQYAAIRECCHKNILLLSDITSFYGTSSGALCSVLLTLGLDFDTLDTYLLDRPWQLLFCGDFLSRIETLMEQSGIYSIVIIEEILDALLRSCGLSLQTTLREFYEYNHKDLYLYTFDLVTQETVELHHSTHGDWTIVQAVYASCCLPFVFVPFRHPLDGHLYIDGAVLVHYPLSFALARHASSPPDSILAIKMATTKKTVHENNTTMARISLLDFLQCLLQTVLSLLHKRYTTTPSTADTPVSFIEMYIEDQIPTSPWTIYLAGFDRNERVRLMSVGSQFVQSFFP